MRFDFRHEHNPWWPLTGDHGEAYTRTTDRRYWNPIYFHKWAQVPYLTRREAIHSVFRTIDRKSAP